MCVPDFPLSYTSCSSIAHLTDLNMELGTFSYSLAVKDLQASRTFYETLGFEVIFGEAQHNWLIMKNGNCTIGLFQGMFEENIMTFNPGWDGNAQPLESFDDVYTIQEHLKSAGIELISEADALKEGRANFMVKDPDGNLILVDQHV